MTHYIPNDPTPAPRAEIIRRQDIIDQVSGLLSIYQEQQRRAGLSDETNGLGPLKRLARESLEREGYVTSMDKRPRLGGGRPRCLTLDLSRASAHLEVDTFPTEQPRGWDPTRLGEEDER